MSTRARVVAPAAAAVVLVLVLVLVLVGCGSNGRGAVQGRPPTSAATAAVETPITSPVVPDSPQSKVLLIGDSTLQAVERYEVLDVLRGFTYTFTAESCRTLGVPSCGDPPVPPNAVEAIAAAEGTFDIVVVMAGYDEWWTSFPSSFDEVVAQARATGASHVIWLTYREGVGYVAPDGSSANDAFVRNNEALRRKATLPENGDVVLADWFAYSAGSTGWLADDGIHLTPLGARAVADYISRTVAFVQGVPCAMPPRPEASAEVVCPDPDLLPAGTVDVVGLYP